ncbi:flavin reductase family protein [Streptomyces sp. NPDC052114]|uniref:flavin reductase family protein n=1 Tax=unclassified Streptomyces TaxID=2593676 RepID=UPI00342A1F45
MNGDGAPVLPGPALQEPVSREDFKEAMTRFATCVTVVTASTSGTPVGCTVTAVFSLTDDPPTMAVSLRTASRTLRDIRAAGTFAVNVLPWHRRELAQRFATADPAVRFDGVGHVLRDGAPVLTDAEAVVVCRTAQEVPLLDHTLLVGTVLSAETAADGQPFVLYQRDAHRLGAH